MIHLHVLNLFLTAFAFYYFGVSRSFTDKTCSLRKEISELRKNLETLDMKTSLFFSRIDAELPDGWDDMNERQKLDEIRRHHQDWKERLWSFEPWHTKP